MRFFSEFRRYRGRRIVTCPETLEDAAVSADAFHAATSGELRLADCSRWPERAGCAQTCLAQIAESPEGCLVRSIVTDWYVGKSCVLCHRPIGPIVWHEAPPALLRTDGTSAEWKDIPLELLRRTFQTSHPLCWYCNNIAELERLKPGWVTRRHGPPVEAEPPLKSDGVY